MAFDASLIIVGTRPEIIKMAPLVRAFKEMNLPHVFLHCGQHYDYNMSQQFIEELELPKPDYGFKFRAQSHGLQTARILALAESVIKKVKPKNVLVEGDTSLAGRLSFLPGTAASSATEDSLTRFADPSVFSRLVRMVGPTPGIVRSKSTPG